MKTHFCRIFSIFFLIFVFNSVSVNAQEFIVWTENYANISIYGPDVFDDGYYHIDRNNGNEDIEIFNVLKEDDIYLVLYNGGFIPDANIIMNNGNILMPVRIISSLCGFNVVWNESLKTVILKENEKEIILKINDCRIIIEDNIKDINNPVQLVGSTTYVSIEFFSEVLNLDVTCHESFYLNNLNIIAIENTNQNRQENQLTVDYYQIQLLEKSIDMYNEIVNSMKIKGYDFDNKNLKNYDPKDIIYTHIDLGRYYIFVLKEFENYPILCNKYEEQIYSSSPGLPLFSLSNGYPNLFFLYQ